MNNGKNETEARKLDWPLRISILGISIMMLAGIAGMIAAMNGW